MGCWALRPEWCPLILGHSKRYLRGSKRFKNELCPAVLFLVGVADYAFVLSYYPVIVKNRPDHHHFHQPHGFYLIIQGSPATILSDPAFAHQT